MSKCCQSCGFLSCNKGKPNPNPEVKSDETHIIYDWYSQENLDRLWYDGLRNGNFLICHSTDPDHAKYGGDPDKKIVPGKGKACLGGVLLIYMHIKIFEVMADGSYRKYKQIVGPKVAMPQGAMAESVIAMMMGRTGLFGGATIQKEFDSNTLNSMMFPTGFDKTLSSFQKFIEREETNEKTETAVPVTEGRV